MVNVEEHNKAVSHVYAEKIILWQDHAHPEGYRSSLTLFKYADGKMALEFRHAGEGWMRPYNKPECDHV